MLLFHKTSFWVDFIRYLSVYDFIDFFSPPYYLLLSACFGFILFFLSFLEVKLRLLICEFSVYMGKFIALKTFISPLSIISLPLFIFYFLFATSTAHFHLNFQFPIINLTCINFPLSDINISFSNINFLFPSSVFSPWHQYPSPFPISTLPSSFLTETQFWVGVFFSLTFMLLREAGTVLNHKPFVLEPGSCSTFVHRVTAPLFQLPFS